MPPTWFTPEQYILAHQYVWEKLEREQNKVSTDPAKEEKITYYNRPKKQVKRSGYDILFNFEPGYDQKMWRSDRTNPTLIQDGIHLEEQQRTVPCLSSSMYGHRRRNLEGRTLFSHKRTHPTQEFYRVNGVNMDPARGLPRDLHVNLS